MGVVFLLGLACVPHEPEVGSLAWLWDEYKHTYVHAAGYVLDPDRDGGSATSEGQGYALLRAAWMDDRETFARVFRWTEDNLRRSDGLYHWLWSPAEGGHVVDENTAADGDQEIALALLLVADAFGVRAYRDRAVEILQAIRAVEWLDLPEGGFPAAGNWAVRERILNPSYFLPYAYPLFDEADPDGGWLDTRRAGYALLERIGRVPGFSLPPDFVVVGTDGEVRSLPVDHPLSSDFSFDAVRIYWRLAVDCLVAPDHLQSCERGPGFDLLVDGFRRHGFVADRYHAAGQALSDTESLSFYGALLPGMQIHSPDLALRIRAEKLAPERLSRLVSATDRYYDANWVWFGLAAADGYLSARLLASTPTRDGPR